MFGVDVILKGKPYPDSRVGKTNMIELFPVLNFEIFSILLSQPHALELHKGDTSNLLHKRSQRTLHPSNGQVRVEN